MSEQKNGEQIATPAELADENLENVAGGVTDGCMPTIPIGTWPPLMIDPAL